MLSTSVLADKGIIETLGIEQRLKSSMVSITCYFPRVKKRRKCNQILLNLSAPYTIHWAVKILINTSLSWVALFGQS